MRCSIGCSPPPKFDVIFGSLLAVSIATGMWHVPCGEQRAACSVWRVAGIYTVRCSLMHAIHNSCQTFVKRKPLIIEAAAKDYGTAAAVAGPGMSLLLVAVPVELLVCRVYVLQLAQPLAAASMCDMCTEGATVGPLLTKHGPWATHNTENTAHSTHSQQTNSRHTHTHRGWLCVHKFLILKWFAFAFCCSVNERPGLDTYLVGGALAEYVAHMGAGHNFESAAAHPGLERQLQILAAPDIKA